MELLYNYSVSKKITSISEEDLDTIMQSRKTLLCHNQERWVKREGDDDFHATMGCYDGAKVCELLGSYLFNKVSNIVPKESVRLYRDDVWCFTRSFRSTNSVRGKLL